MSHWSEKSTHIEGLVRKVIVKVLNIDQAHIKKNFYAKAMSVFC